MAKQTIYLKSLSPNIPAKPAEYKKKYKCYLKDGILPNLKEIQKEMKNKNK